MANRKSLQAQRELIIRPTPFALRKLGDLSDINIENAEDGSVLVLDAETGKWTAQRLLDKQFINGGNF